MKRGYASIEIDDDLVYTRVWLSFRLWYSHKRCELKTNLRSLHLRLCLIRSMIQLDDCWLSEVEGLVVSRSCLGRRFGYCYGRGYIFDVILFTRVYWDLESFLLFWLGILVDPKSKGLGYLVMALNLSFLSPSSSFNLWLTANPNR